MKLDILAFGAHPDDIELSCAGTLIVHGRKGLKTGVVDLTRGELGTRGTPELRMQESAEAAKILGLSVRENLEMADGWFENNTENQMAIIRKVRQFQPEIVLANAKYDRHPDHGRGAALVEEAVFKAGLQKIETLDVKGNLQAPWRPKKLFHYIQSVSLTPDFLVDVSEARDDIFKAIKAYRSQFYDPNSDEPETYISSSSFLTMIESRGRELGHRIGVDYAEGFQYSQFLGVRNLFDLK